LEGEGRGERERTVCVNPEKLLAGTCIVKTPVRECTILPPMVIDNVNRNTNTEKSKEKNIGEFEQ